MVYAALYLSRPIHPMSEADLAEILSVSRLKNAERGITGRLIYAAPEAKPGLFAQWLEGEDWRVRDLLYMSILRDRRHALVGKPFEGPVKRRQFSSWTMGFERLESEEAVSHEVDALVAMTHRIQPSSSSRAPRDPASSKPRYVRLT